MPFRRWRTARAWALAGGLSAALLGSTPALAGGGVNCGFGDFEGTSDTLSVYGLFAAEQPGGDYRVPVVAWVHEQESDRLRVAALAALRAASGIPEGTREGDLFRERTSSFLHDNERGEKVVCAVGTRRELSVGTTDEGGFAEATLTVSAADAAGVRSGADGTPSLELSFHTGTTGGRFRVPIVPVTGVSVVSDVDDTVKVTEVLNAREMVKNTFSREFRAVPGMAALYRRWASEGHAFHYVSAGPWQLAPALGAFLEKEGFPAGVLHLRRLRLKSARSLHAFLTESEASKLERIGALLKLSPQRRFILVGDSGERDPEIYGELARQFPEQVTALYIREVPGADHSAARFEGAFAQVPKEKVHRFAQPQTLPGAPSAPMPRTSGADAGARKPAPPTP